MVAASQFDSIIFLKTLINLVTHMLIGIFTYDMFKHSLNFSSTEMKLHGIFCTIGYLFLMAEGFLVFSKDNVWTSMCKRNANKILHIALFTIGSVLAVIGVGIEIYNKHPKKHFTTSHGITGFISIILVVISCLSGALIEAADKLFPSVRRVIFKFVHYLIGLIAFIIGVVSTYYECPSDDLVVVLILITILSLLNSLKSLYTTTRSLL